MPPYCKAITPVKFATSVELVFDAEAVALARGQRTRLDQHLRSMAVNRECGLGVIFLVLGTWNGNGTDLGERRKVYLIELLRRQDITSKFVHIHSGRIPRADTPSQENAVKIHFIGNPGVEGCAVQVNG